MKVAGSVETSATIPLKVSDEWRTIVVPQTVPAGTALFSITIGGVPYKFVKNEAFTYVSGKMMKFTIKVDKIADSGKYGFTLLCEGIVPWENDIVSHDATAKEYVIVNSTAGNLRDSIIASYKDLTKVRHMKVTGSVNANDFFFMRDHMPWLTDLNLKNVRIERVEISGIGNGHVAKYADDELPNECFHNKKTLRSVVLPDVLGRIGNNAFHNAGLTGSLNVPEGVEEIGHDAFVDNDLIGILTLPSTLKKMGSFAFGGCGFVCPLNLPNGLEEIGDGCFSDCQNLYGKLILLSRLKKLGVRAFHNCQALEGDLVIPKSLTVIPDSAFMDCKLGGRLQLHDGITSIGDHAFAGNGFKDGLALPNRLKVLEGGNFIGNNFSGSLKIPTGLLRISEEAFAGCTFTGDVEIPEGIMHLHKRAFAGSENLQKIILPSDLELIDEEAFRDCKSLRVIECKSIFPPVVKKSAFSGVPLQDITVMVPESALNDYKQSGSWSAFGRIIAKTK